MSTASVGREPVLPIHVPCQRINEIVKRRRRVTPPTALRLAKTIGVSPDYWLNLQLRWDFYQAQREEAAELALIRAFRQQPA